MKTEIQAKVRAFKVEIGNKYRILGEIWLPSEFLTEKCLIWVHWMDSRGYRSLNLYKNAARFFSSRGYVVVLYDQLGAGRSRPGRFAFPRRSSLHFIKVAERAVKIVREEYPNKVINPHIIGIGHSLGGVTIMEAVKRGFQLKAAIFLSTPPSHGRATRRGIIREHGYLKYLVFKILAYLDFIPAVLGKPLTYKLFGFRLYYHEIVKELLQSHAARLMKKYPNLPMLAIFGENDEYIEEEDFSQELPHERYPWIKRVFIPQATHDMVTHQEIVFKHIVDFLNSVN